MKKDECGLTVLDLFCGAGGFSEGFHQAGFDVVFGIDNWEPACRTHDINNLGETRKQDILAMDVDQILTLKKELNQKYGEIDVIIGSPPCSEFSYAKNGGKGDIEKGMILVRRNLLFVALFKPKYWLMENVPRLRDALNQECVGSLEEGWSIRYEKLKIPQRRFKELGLEGTSQRIPKGCIVNSIHFGTHQNRRRFIAGDFPLEEIPKPQMTNFNDRSLGALIQAMENNFYMPRKNGLMTDPNYPYHKVKKKHIRDYEYNPLLHPMSLEEIRHSKRRHIQYGRMCLPENLEAPARTVLAAWFPRSRESLVLKTDEVMVYHGRPRALFRVPTVREVACIQGFPINFQLCAGTLEDRYTLVGNAVPCQLAYAFAKLISNEIERKLHLFVDKAFRKRAKVTLKRQKRCHNLPIISKPLLIVDEASDFNAWRGKQALSSMGFGARPTKRIRRKLPSSELSGISCMVVFDNLSSASGKIDGGPFWKGYLQKGIGKRYSRICLDEVSVPQLISFLNESFDEIKIMDLARHLLLEVRKGIPVLKEGWIEFPGWTQKLDPFLSFISEERLKLPAISFFQKAFTEELKDVGNFISPIDLFDGLDAIMLSVFSIRKFRNLQRRTIHVDSLSDSNKYHYKSDPRIVTKLLETEIPLVTAMSCLLSVQVLNAMYEEDCSLPKGDSYPEAIRMAADSIAKWCFGKLIKL
jgi:DNA-cytosine methyltransferase